MLLHYFSVFYFVINQSSRIISKVPGKNLSLVLASGMILYDDRISLCGFRVRAYRSGMSLYDMAQGVLCLTRSQCQKGKLL